MTATNICYNFVGFRCSPPLTEAVDGKLRNAARMSVRVKLWCCIVHSPESIQNVLRTRHIKGNGPLGIISKDTLE